MYVFMYVCMYEMAGQNVCVCEGGGGEESKMRERKEKRNHG